MNRPNRVPTTAESAVLVYAVTKESPAHTLLFSSANFTNTPAGGEPLDRKAKPFGNKHFVVLLKDGTGQVLNARQVGKTNLIGAFAPLCH